MNPKSVIGAKKTPSNLVRPQYSQGLLLNDDDLTQAVDYTRDLNRLLMRSLLGCGVVCGLLVKAGTECGKLKVTVDAGVALDCHGDPLHLPTASVVCIDPSCGVQLPAQLWVLIRRYDKHCAPRSSICSPDDDDSASVSTRIREGVEVSVVSALPDCACGCSDSDTDTTSDSPKAVDPATGAALPSNTSTDTSTDADTIDPCYKDHYAGICSQCCTDDCACEWLVLARLNSNGESGWTADHSVRRFVRPVLMADPQAAIERKAKK